MKYIKLFEEINIEVDGYTYEKYFNYFINDITGDSPRQISDLISMINNKEKSGKISIVFYDEIKDGRSVRFNIKTPLLLKNKSFSYKGIDLKINDIIYTEHRNTPSESGYSDYHYYTYSANITFS